MPTRREPAVWRGRLALLVLPEVPDHTLWKHLLSRVPPTLVSYKGLFPSLEEQRAPELQNAILLRSKRQPAEASSLQLPSDPFVLARGAGLMVSGHAETSKS